MADSGTYTYTLRSKGTKKILSLSCTASGAAAFSITLPTAIMNWLDGSYLVKVKAVPGDTAPTDASDLSITDSAGFVLMSPTGNGLDLIDSTSSLWNYPDGPIIGGTNDYTLIVKETPLVIAVTNNVVNSATFDITLELEIK